MQLQKLRGRDRLRLASRRMQIKENLIFLMGAPLNCCLATVFMGPQHKHISAPNIRSTSQRSLRGEFAIHGR